MINSKDKQSVAPLIETKKTKSIEEMKEKILNEDVAIQYIYDLIFDGDFRAIDVLIYIFDQCRNDEILSRVASGPFELALERFAPKARKEFIAHSNENSVLKNLLFENK